MSDRKKPARKEPKPKAVELHEDQLEDVAGGGDRSTGGQIKWGDIVLKK
jgi:hypothetical protein